ncbi:MAG TPA: autoinducer binding domain-containing protein [Caulobacterales bacterium]|nr:autoinducer binding domain-containing protein [Caulobacterales bacterium]
MTSIRTALDFIDKASLAADMSELQALLRRTLDDEGVTHFALLALARSPNGARMPMLLNEPVHVAWAEHYQNEGYYNVDAVVHRVLGAPNGVTWSDVEAQPMSRAARNLFGECRSALRVDGGFALPTYDVDGFAGVIAMYYAEEPDSERLRAFKLIGHFAMERAKELHGLNTDGVGACPLTAQQREILAFSAHGKSDLAIGEAMGLSHKTINHHVERAKSTLGVRTRRQAIAIALQRGWIMIG